jgi:hypothetical protein
MPDFIVETEWQCSSLHIHERRVGGYLQWNLFEERVYPKCTCPAYKFGKRSVSFGGGMFPEICKHIQQAEKDVCGWHSFTRPFKDICPKCGLNVVPVSIAV